MHLRLGILITVLRFLAHSEVIGNDPRLFYAGDLLLGIDEKDTAVRSRTGGEIQDETQSPSFSSCRQWRSVCLGPGILLLTSVGRYHGV